MYGREIRGMVEDRIEISGEKIFDTEVKDTLIQISRLTQ